MATSGSPLLRCESSDCTSALESTRDLSHVERIKMHSRYAPRSGASFWSEGAGMPHERFRPVQSRLRTREGRRIRAVELVVRRRDQEPPEVQEQDSAMADPAALGVRRSRLQHAANDDCAGPQQCCDPRDGQFGCRPPPRHLAELRAVREALPSEVGRRGRDRGQVVHQTKPTAPRLAARTTVTRITVQTTGVSSRSPASRVPSERRAERFALSLGDQPAAFMRSLAR